MNFNDIKGVTENLKANFDQMLQMSNKIISEIPNEYAEKRAEIQNDVAEIMEAVKKQDFSKLTDLNKKYADNNTK